MTREAGLSTADLQELARFKTSTLYKVLKTYTNWRSKGLFKTTILSFSPQNTPQAISQISEIKGREKELELLFSISDLAKKKLDYDLKNKNHGK